MNSSPAECSVFIGKSSVVVCDTWKIEVENVPGTMFQLSNDACHKCKADKEHSAFCRLSAICWMLSKH